MESLVAELETRFALPVESPWLKQRYNYLKVTQEELKKVEENHLKLSIENEANDVKVEALRHRRDFLEKLLKSLKDGKEIEKSSKKAVEGMEQKGKQQIHQLEDDIETKQKNNKKLKKLIDEETEQLRILKEQGSLLKQSELELKIRLSEIEESKNEIEKTFSEDEKTIQEMETFFFKMASNLFQLQREVNKLDLNFLLNPMTSEQNQNDILTGFHRISHLLDDMGKEQKKFVLKEKYSDPVIKREFLAEEENQWLERESQVQRTNNRNLKLEQDRLIDKISDIQKKFLITIEETQILLESYADVESKNMAIKLREARLNIMGQLSKFEPEYPMYQKYNQTVEESNKLSSNANDVYEKLYERKQEYAVLALEELQKCENKLEIAKSDMKQKFISFKEMPKSTLNQIFYDSIRKLNPTFLHTLLIKKSTFSSTDDIPNFQYSEAAKSRISEYFKKMASRRKKLFEEHLQKSLKVLETDLKKIKDEISEIENSLWGLHKSILESEAKKKKEEETVQRLEARLKVIKLELERKKNEKQKEKSKVDEKWIQEAAEIEEKLIQAKEEKEALRTQKCSLMEALRQVKIDENNLRHRLKVFEALQKARKQGIKEHKSIEAAIDAEIQKKIKLEEDLEKLKAFLSEAWLQEQNLESNVEKQRYMKIKEEEEVLEAEKEELQKELDHLSVLIDKLIFNSDKNQ